MAFGSRANTPSIPLHAGEQLGPCSLESSLHPDSQPTNIPWPNPRNRLVSLLDSGYDSLIQFFFPQNFWTRRVSDRLTNIISRANRRTAVGLSAATVGISLDQPRLSL